MSKPRISLAVPSFSGGGAERVMITLANKFDELGYLVDFVVMNDKGPYRSMLNARANKVVLKQGTSFFAVAWAFFRLIKYLSRTDADSIMSTTKTFDIFVGLAMMLSFCKVKHVVRAAAVFHKSKDAKFFYRTGYMSAVKFIYSRADRVIANSTATKLSIIDCFGILSDKIHVLYNPLDIKNIDGKKTENRTLSLLAVGRLSKSKNFSDLIRVMPALREKYPSLTLTVLGVGEELSTLKELVAQLSLDDVVDFRGFVDDPFTFYRRCRVFVQTSLTEGFGYVLVEAMACGTPVVAYDGNGAMREILEDGKYGSLVPPGNLEALANAIIKQIEDPTGLELLANSVLRFDADIIAKQYLNNLEG